MSLCLPLSPSVSLCLDLTYLCRELECNVYSLGGLLRHHMAEDHRRKLASKSASSHSRSILDEIARHESMLMMAIRPVCVFDMSDPSDQRAAVPHTVSFPPYPLVAVQTLTQYYSAKYQETPPHELRETLFGLALFTDRASALYGQYYSLKTRELPQDPSSSTLVMVEGDPITGELYSLFKQMKDSLETSIQFYKQAGEVRPSPLPPLPISDSLCLSLCLSSPSLPLCLSLSHL
jgi:hypothetical protein